MLHVGSSVTNVLHLINTTQHACRCYKLDPGFLEAHGSPAPLAPAQRMMLAAQVRESSAWCLACFAGTPAKLSSALPEMWQVLPGAGA